MPDFYEYPAVVTKQSPESPAVVLFSAPCTEVVQWAGIPQKKSFSGQSVAESIGFQREENTKRIGEIRQFFSNSKNVVQNPILCTSRSGATSEISFIPAVGQEDSLSKTGTVQIPCTNVAAMSFYDLLEKVRTQLEVRIPELAARNPTDSLVEQLKRAAVADGHLAVADCAELDPTDEAVTPDIAEASSALFEETHVADFWEEIAARALVAKDIPPERIGDSFLGFSREALGAYILPAVVVDGQHRLRGAAEHANWALARPPFKEELERRIAGGEDAAVVNEDMLTRASRRLPVSLLLSADAAEQVFQFVVVNQKATPIGKALLGTIVSTTLSQSELDSVADRLKNAGVQLDESRAISFLAKSPNSPFYGKVQRGLDIDSNDLLEWSVLGQLASMFKNLRGARLFHENNNDYADRWRKKHLDASEIVAGCSTQGHESPFSYWSANDGPWRDVFIAFWSAVRDKLADKTDEEAKNYWGNPRSSNLFNKISLTILTADFFQYLCDQKRSIANSEQVKTDVGAWLEEVQAKYFSRDWNLAGTKKDSTGIKKQWSSLWSEYRRNPERVPRIENYRNPKSD